MIAFPPASAPRVSIVIVTARRPERLLRCLTSVEREAPADLRYEVVIVLNAAEPEMRERLHAEVQGARIVSSDIPLGFAGGANLGARHAGGELLHLLHDDTDVCAGWLAALTSVLDEHAEAGAAGSLTLELDGGVQTAGYVLWRDGSTGPPWTGSPPEPDSLRAAFPVDYCGSASILIRRTAWEATGGFDEDFHPAYYVDVDLAMALRAHGYVVLCEPTSRVRHERGGSSSEAFRTFVSGRNRDRFLTKWDSDLAHQEPRADGDDGLARAHRATVLRTASVAASGRRSTARVPVPRGSEDALDRLRRERRQLQRDVAVKQEFIDHAEHRLAEAASTRARLEADGATAQRALADLHEQIAAVDRHYAALVDAYEQLASDRDRIGALLAEAEATPRLPRRLRPLVPLWRRMRGRARRAR